MRRERRRKGAKEQRRKDAANAWASWRLGIVFQGRRKKKRKDAKGQRRKEAIGMNSDAARKSAMNRTGS
jgi:hypothetical protein